MQAKVIDASPAAYPVPSALELVERDGEHAALRAGQCLERFHDASAQRDASRRPFFVSRKSADGASSQCHAIRASEPLRGAQHWRVGRPATTQRQVQRRLCPGISHGFHVLRRPGIVSARSYSLAARLQGAQAPALPQPPARAIAPSPPRGQRPRVRFLIAAQASIGAR